MPKKEKTRIATLAASQLRGLADVPAGLRVWIITWGAVDVADSAVRSPCTGWILGLSLMKKAPTMPYSGDTFSSV